MGRTYSMHGRRINYVCIFWSKNHTQMSLGSPLWRLDLRVVCFEYANRFFSPRIETDGGLL